jgi:hypothetical protein
MDVYTATDKELCKEFVALSGENVNNSEFFFELIITHKIDADHMADVDLWYATGMGNRTCNKYLQFALMGLYIEHHQLPWDHVPEKKKVVRVRKRRAR